MHFSDSLSRRRFLSGGTIALASVAALGMPSLVFGSGKQPIKLGLIGCGQRGGGIASIIQKIPGLEISAYCDVSEYALTEMKAYSGRKTKFYKHHHELLKNKDIDGVIIATPLYLHYPMAIDAIDAGKHVYVEKTMTYNAQEAHSLINKMKESKLVFQVGHQYRYFAMYHKIKQILSENWLGTITHFESQYNRNSSWRRELKANEHERQVNWRMYREYSGGLLAELAAHQIDIVNWMLDGHPNKVVGMGDVNYWKDGREINDNVRTIYEYDNGVKSSVTSILSNQHNSYSIRILGSDATIEINRNSAFLYPERTKKVLGTVDGVTGATIEGLKSGGGKPILFENPDGLNMDPTYYAFLSFADCIRNGKTPDSNVLTGRDAAVAVHIGNKAIDSGNTQIWE